MHGTVGEMHWGLETAVFEDDTKERQEDAAVNECCEPGVLLPR